MRLPVLFFASLLSLLHPATAPADGAITKAPDFRLPAIANADGTIGLDSYLGKVTYLDFWASWCGPCRLSLPALDALYKELRSEGLEVVAVSVDVVDEDSLDFLKRYPVSYPVAIDTTGDIARSYSVGGMPSGYLIDRTGAIRAVHVGFKRGDEEKLRLEIMELLEE
jgi:thiol-disulfide isomerase/thioredoxin